VDAGLWIKTRMDIRMNFRSSLIATAALPLLTMGLWGCDGATLTNGDAASEAANNPTAVVSDDPVSAGPDNQAIGAPVSIVSALSADIFMANESAAGQIKVMAVGDSITHGVSGTKSYRHDFTNMLTGAACNFEMVGSQTSSRTGSGNSNCTDTGAIGDGWGSSCCVVAHWFCRSVSWSNGRKHN